MLSIQNVSVAYGTKSILNDISFEVPSGSITALVGPSGCGKSTLLKAILGTHPPTLGNIFVNGENEPILHPTREVGIVYQDYSLYEFLSARDNVAFGPKLDQTSLAFRILFFWKWWKIRKTINEKADKTLLKVGLNGHGDLYPLQMSGGMRQRVAIAQAIIMKPKVLLLDEPFGALDEATREELQIMLLEFYQENLQAKKEGKLPPYTIVIVTHELNEAIYVSDRVIGLAKREKGAIVVYDQPAPIFHPNDPKDINMAMVVKQREEIRKTVFD